MNVRNVMYSIKSLKYNLFYLQQTYQHPMGYNILELAIATFSGFDEIFGHLFLKALNLWPQISIAKYFTGGSTKFANIFRQLIIFEKGFTVNEFPSVIFYQIPEGYIVPKIAHVAEPCSKNRQAILFKCHSDFFKELIIEMIVVDKAANYYKIKPIFQMWWETFCTTQSDFFQSLINSFCLGLFQHF